MALKLPKLVLPAYDLGNRPARYRHFAEAVLNANSGSGLAVTKDAVDKAWCTAVKKHWPSNKDKQEEMFRQASSLSNTSWWKKDEIEYIWTQDHFRGTRTMGTVRSNGTNVSLPNCGLERLDYVKFATTTLPEVNPNLECTREIVDDAWTATIESQKFKGTPKKVKDAALAQAKTAKANQYWKGRRRDENLEGLLSNQYPDEIDCK